MRSQEEAGLTKLPQLTLRWRVVAFTILIGVSSVAVAEEYWQIWLHSTDAQTFDGDALSIGPLDATAARASANYVAVARDKGGRPLEAVQMLGGKPNYHYTYWYDDKGRPVLRRFEYWGEGAFRRIGEVVWDRDREGRLLSSGYYVWPAGSPDGMPGRLVAVKVYTGSNFVLHDYRKAAATSGSETGRKLEAIRDSLSRIERLEKRNILQKILGW